MIFHVWKVFFSAVDWVTERASCTSKTCFIYPHRFSFGEPSQHEVTTEKRLVELVVVVVVDDPFPQIDIIGAMEGKRENFQVCSMQYCAQQLCTVQCTHI